MTFIISLSPQYSDAKLSIKKTGEALTINGDLLDFSDLPEGGEYPTEAVENSFVIGGVKRLNGDIHITVLMPFSNPDAPISVTFPEPLLVTSDGDVALPEGRKPAPYKPIPEPEIGVLDEEVTVNAAD